jgi:MFS family permease
VTAFLRTQIQDLRYRMARRLSLLFHGPDPHHQPERNIWHLYQDILWIGLAGAASSFTSVYAIRLGASEQLIGLLSSIPALVVILLRLPAVELVERTGDRVSLISRSLLGARGFYLILALLPLLGLAHEAVVFVALVILMGLPAIVANAGWDSLFADVVPERDRATVVSVRNSLASAIAVVVVLMAGKWLDWIPFPWNYQGVFLLAFVGGLVSTYHVSRIKPPLAHPVSADKKGFHWREIRELFVGRPDFTALVVATFVYQMAMSLPSPLYNIYFVRHLQATDGWIGFRSTISSLTPILAYRFWPRLVRRWGDRAVLALCVPMTVLLPLGTGLFQSLAPQLLVIAWFGLFGPAVFLTRYNILLRVSPAENRPTAIGVFAIIANIAAFIAPLVGVQLMNWLGIRNVFFLAAAVRLAGALLFWRLPRDRMGSPPALVDKLSSWAIRRG